MQIRNQSPIPATGRPSPRNGISFLGVLGVLAAIGLLLFLFSPVHRTAREPARRSQCKNNLKQLGLALHNYHDKYGCFPPAYTVDAEGKPLHSWRTLILPFADQQALYEKIDLTKPWDDPANAEAAQTRSPEFVCPSQRDVSKLTTTYLAVVGDNNAFHPTQGRKLSEVTRDSSSVVMVLEVPEKNAVHWMSPQDTTAAAVLSLTDSPDNPHSPGMHALFADGSVQHISGSTPPEERQVIISDPIETP